MLGMGHLLCGTITIPKDSRVAILGGTRVKVASSLPGEGHPALSPSLQLVCAAFCTGGRRVPQSTRTGMPSRDCPHCWEWANRDLSLPGSETAQEKVMESEMGGWECDSGCVTPGLSPPEEILLDSWPGKSCGFLGPR